MNDNIPHITVVEDDELLRHAIINLFTKQNYKVTGFPSGKGVVDYINQNQTDVLLCDIMLPDDDGFNIIKQLHSNTSVGKIFISAKSQVTDKIAGLSLGVDDYVCKPFDQTELSLRVKTLVNRLRPQKTKDDSSLISILNLQLNIETRDIKYRKQSINLGENEFNVLMCLKAQQGKICSRDKLINALYTPDGYQEGRGLDILISRLRKKLTQLDPSCAYITTFRGKGYMLLLTTS